MDGPSRRCWTRTLAVVLLFLHPFFSHGFTPSSSYHSPLVKQLYASTRGNSMYAPAGGNQQRQRSKRQERVSQLIHTELARILHSGLIKGHDVDYLETPLRRSISIVQSDVSPDLRQARITVSIRGDGPSTRKAYAWLVQHAKPLKHSLALQMSHMKACPSLTFVQVDVSAAVDVMHLIDKISKGSYKREDLYNPESVPTGVVGGVDFAEKGDDADEAWDDGDDAGFFDALD